MAKQLYDYWFVQFDFPNEEGKPYKSSGGAMVWNEKLKREIPEGWNVMSINEICTSCRGVSYGKDDLLSNSNGVLVLRGNNIENNHIVYDSNVAFVPYDFVSEEQHIKEGDIIMTMSSGSKAHVGKCAMFHKDSEHTFGAFLSKFTPKKELRYMTFLFLTSEYFKSLITAFCNGTGINNLTNQTFDDVLLVLPDEKKTRLFESKVNGLFAMIGNNEENERILIKQRDELLPLLMNGQASVNSDLSVYKKKRRGRIPSLTLNQVSDIQILHRQSIVLLTKQVLMDELQSERLIILVIIPFGTEIFVPIAWHVLLEETSQVFQAFGLVLLEVAAHNDDAPVGEVASSVAVLPEADVAVQITLTDVHAKAVGILHHATTVSVAELLTQVEIEIKNQIFLFHN